MSSILMKGVIRNGRVEVEEPINLPDGLEVIVRVLNGDGDAGLEEGWDSSPQGIAAWLQWCDAIQPLKITPAEEADAEAWLRTIGQRGTANLDTRVEDLFMIRYLLDTNAVGDLINHRRGVDVRAKDARQRGAVIGTCELVVAELFFGVENSATKDENLPLLRHSLGGLKCWPLSRAASQEFGRLAALLKREGRAVGAIDILIAAVAMTLPNCVVVSRDKDMLEIPGLNVENWAS